MQHVTASSAPAGSFHRFHTNVGQFDVSEKTLLIPSMAPFASRFLAAAFRAMGVNARVMDTYKGLGLGRQYTSGKECFPCQITLGDILSTLEAEKQKLGHGFEAAQYAYFMPEAGGPCRFGMYNKLHRLILDRFPEFKEVPIVYLSTADSYSTSDIMPPERSSIFRRLSYVAIIMADVLDRTVWRVRPYEIRSGITDAFMETALRAMEHLLEATGTEPDYARFFNLLEHIVATAASFVDARAPRRPRIGIVGEIYLRTHPDSNQDIIRQLERLGAEVVDASLGEWINFITFDQGKRLRRAWKKAWMGKDRRALRQWGKKALGNRVEHAYQRWRQWQVYARALKHLDIHTDHDIRHLERQLRKDTLFNFHIGTEAALSIGGALAYIEDGFDGIVNVFPFTCMPSTICASVLKPLLHEMSIPYLDAPYDGTIQANREIALRTFVHQAAQHKTLRGLRGTQENKATIWHRR